MLECSQNIYNLCQRYKDVCPFLQQMSFLSDSEYIRSCHEKFLETSCSCCSVSWSCPIFLQPHRLQHARLLCPLLCPRICSDSCPLSWWKKVQELVIQSCLNLCNPMDCSMPGSPVLHHLLELAETHVHQVGDAIQPSRPLSFPSPPAFSLSQHQGLFQGVNSSHQVAKVLEIQLQHQSFQWIFRIDFL